MRFDTLLFTSILGAGYVNAHMEMSYPFPFRSKFNPNETNADYDNTSPLDASGGDFPCKKYHEKGEFEPVASYPAGQTGRMTIAGSAVHDGGSCQVSLSYDKGKTFKVIQSMIGGCPLPKEYDFTIPVSAPHGGAILAWTWFNLVGNREMYMNCAPVSIENSSRNSSHFQDLPDLFVANIGNGCSTEEGKETVFKNPGDKVLYGGNVNESSPPFPVCEKTGRWFDFDFDFD